MNGRPPPRRGRPTLAERAAASGVGAAGRKGSGSDRTAPPGAGSDRTAPPGAGSDRTAPSPTPKHCWVVDPRWPGRRPALLLQWRQRAGGWQGHIALVVGDATELTIVWVPAERLSQA
jgi:hypothetical protein